MLRFRSNKNSTFFGEKVLFRVSEEVIESESLVLLLFSGVEKKNF